MLKGSLSLQYTCTHIGGKILIKEESLTCVRSHVDDKILFLGETLGTPLTLKWFLTCPNKHIRSQHHKATPYLPQHPLPAFLLHRSWGATLTDPQVTLKNQTNSTGVFQTAPPPHTHTHTHTPTPLLVVVCCCCPFCCCCCCYCYCFAVASAGIVSSWWSACISAGRVLNHTHHSLTLISSHHQQAFFTQLCHGHFYFKTVQTDQVLLCPDIYLWFDDYDISFWHDLHGWVGAKHQE